MPDYETNLFRKLSDDGTSTGSKDAAVDGSVTPVRFYIKPAAGEEFHITRMLIHVRDNANFTAEGYGGLGVLTNGIDICLWDDGAQTLDLCDGVPIKANAGWGRECYDAAISDYGAGDNYLNVRWTFDKSGQPLHLNGDRGEEFGVQINDNLSTLVDHYFTVQGWIGPKDMFK